MSETSLLFYLNGNRVELNHIEPEMTLLQYLRDEGYTGSKLGCGEGGCGACTVMLSHYSPDTKQITHRAVNGCLMPLAAVDGFAVTTVEGLGNTRDGLNPVQERIANSNGSQCGFCTPGIVMALYAYLRSHPNASKEEIEDCLDGNLCRCTGYRPILDAAKTFAIEESEAAQSVSYTAAEMVQEGAKPPSSGAGICPSTGKPCDCKSQSDGNTNEPKSICFNPNNITSHLIFPPSLKKYEIVSKVLKGERTTWYRPTTLQELLQLKKEHPKAKLVIGNTEVGIERKFKNMKYPVVIAPTHVPDLLKLEKTDDGVHIGSSVTLSNLQTYLQELIKTIPEYQIQTLTAILHQIRWFAGNQIRNAAAVGGNICTASPISDLNPVFLAVNAILTIESADGGERTLPIREFFIRYRVVNLEETEVLKSIFVPFTRKNEYCHAYKQARRRDDDIAIVTAGMRVHLEQQGNEHIIKEIAFGYGGMAAISVFCRKTEEKLLGATWNDDLLPIAYKLLEEDLPLADDAVGGMIQFRRTLTTSFFYKFFLRVTKQIAPEKIDSKLASAIPDFHKEVSSGTQDFNINEDSAPVNKPLVHTSAHKQVTGEAIYTDDIATGNGYYASFVLSTKSHAKILSIDASKALEARGVVAFLSGKDITGSNEIGPVITSDEPLFPVDFVTAMSQPVGMIIAKTHDDARDASRLVNIEYEELEPIITIPKAIENQLYHKPILSIVDGNVEEAFKNSDHVIEGEMESGAQEHFYLEPHSSYAIPGEGQEIKVIASTQNPTKTQKLVAHVLGIPDSKVVVTVKRMGGGFGGKETRSCHCSCAAALAAYKLRKPIKFVLDRDVDMITSGMRHPFLGRYKVGFNNDGKIQALEINLYSNAGNSMDLSVSVMERALFHVDNCYKIPNVKATGYCCKTNITSNTAFRGFGGPQSMLICETWIERMSIILKKDIHEIRRLNFYKDGDATHYKQVPSDNNIVRIYNQIVESSEYNKRLDAVNQFNANNRWKKRGISIVPTKFGMSFTVKFLNQAGALVHVYTDGSVLVTHGGTEMGQGLHTKIVQIAARTLNIPVERVHISETSTDKVPNTSPTAASVQSDLNGMAVKIACDKIIERLAPIKEKHPDYSWEKLVSAAYFDRIDLSAHGFYATPNVGYNFADATGSPFNYFVWGAACSEVEIDVLSGDYYVRRTDIVMDLGESLNPSIDIGQIEGGFVQGLGWCTLEEVVWFDNGYQFTRGPGNYKIPSFNDVPVDFRVSLLKDSSNKKAIYSSKGVGEPPFFLGSSVLFAIKNACRSARIDANLPDEFFTLQAPATAERIRLACADTFTNQFSKK